MSLTAHQLELRKTRIGSSEIATIAGLNPFQNPIDLWQQKMGLETATRSPELEEAAAWGHCMEPLLAQWYSEKCAIRLVTSPTLICEAYPWACATPDRLWEDLSVGVEIKNVGARVAWHWTPEAPPDYVLAQVHWQMMVTGLRQWDVVASIAGMAPVIYPIERNDEFLAKLVQAGLDFQAMIANDCPPPVDGSDSYKSFLARRFPRGKGRERDESIANWAKEYLAAREDLKAEEERMKLAANSLRNRIGSLDEVWGDWGKVSWKTDKNGTRTLRVSSKADKVSDLEF